MEKLKFEDKYEKKALIEPADIKTLMQNVENLAVRKGLIKEMNFRQIYAVKEALPENEFIEVIAPSSQEQRIKDALKIWRSILVKVPTIQTPKELEQSLQAPLIRAMVKEDPFVGTAICKVWESVHKQDASSIITSSQIFIFLTNKASSEELVTLEVEGHPPIQANRSLLIANSGYFARMLSAEGGMEESHKTSIVMHEIEDFETFDKFIKILTYQTVPLNPSLIQKLMKLANCYFSMQLLESLDLYMATHPHLFENLRTLAQDYPDLKHIRACFENQFIGRKLTNANWESTLKDAEEFKFEKLKEKCALFAQQELIAAVDATPMDSRLLQSWFDKCKQILSPKGYEGLLDSLKTRLRIENIAIIYKEAALAKHTLKSTCEEFYTKNAKQLKEGDYWNLFDIPEDLASLFLSEETFSVPKEPSEEGVLDGKLYEPKEKKEIDMRSKQSKEEESEEEYSNEIPLKIIIDQ